MVRYIWYSTVALVLLAIGSAVAYTVQSFGVNSLPLSAVTRPIKIIEPVPSTKRASFMAVGDIMLSRNVAAKIQAAHDPLLPFRQLSELFLTTDFNFANLESPFSGSDNFNPSPSIVFNAPRTNVQGLTDYRFRVLSLANNHALDQGIKGLEYTRRHLSEHGITGIGAGSTIDEAWQPAIVEVNGVRIGFIASSYASLNDNGKASNTYVARLEDLDNLQRALADAKQRSDFVVVSMHAGTEYTTKPNQAQRDFAHAAIDHGADLVIGHHSHWVQELERYQGRYIFYSLGNFIFDQEWSRATKEGLAVVVELKQVSGVTSLAGINPVPLVIENYSTPRPASAAEAVPILARLGDEGHNLKQLSD